MLLHRKAHLEFFGSRDIRLLVKINADIYAGMVASLACANDPIVDHSCQAKRRGTLWGWCGAYGL